MTGDIQHGKVAGEKRIRETQKRGDEEGKLRSSGAYADGHPGWDSTGRAEHGHHGLRDSHHERECCCEMADFGNHTVLTYLSTTVLPALFDNRFASSIDCAASRGM